MVNKVSLKAGRHSHPSVLTCSGHKYISWISALGQHNFYLCPRLNDMIDTALGKLNPYLFSRLNYMT